MPNPFSLASEERTRTLLADVGFSTVRLQEVAVRFGFDDVNEYVRFATDTAGPAVPVLGALSDNEREALTAQLANGFSSFASDGGYVLPGLALAGAAIRAPA